MRFFFKSRIYATVTTVFPCFYCLAGSNESLCNTNLQSFYYWCGCARESCFFSGGGVLGPCPHRGWVFHASTRSYGAAPHRFHARKKRGVVTPEKQSCRDPPRRGHVSLVSDLQRLCGAPPRDRAGVGGGWGRFWGFLGGGPGGPGPKCFNLEDIDNHID